MKKGILIYLLPLFLLFVSSPALFAQISVDAGADASLCKGDTAFLGGNPTASGGTAPYTYSWVPAAGLNSTTIANPFSMPSKNTTYTVFVSDANGSTGYGTVTVDIYKGSLASAGLDTSLCDGDSIRLGTVNNTSASGVTYTWSPGATLSDSTKPRPYALPSATITYSLTVNSPNCPTITDQVTVSVNPLPTIIAGTSTTILQGESTTLTASGGVTYTWIPGPYISAPTSASTLVYPQQTTLYYAIGVDANGCSNYDTVMITVKPSNKVILYNTFTPNGDGKNDLFYIGNLYKFPNNKITIYSRYGKVVYTSSPYNNDWDGKASGDELPAATYYFVLELGDTTDPVHGSITIIR